MWYCAVGGKEKKHLFWANVVLVGLKRELCRFLYYDLGTIFLWGGEGGKQKK